MVSWNVAGVPLEEIGAFLKHTRDIHPWDFLCLQEAFRKTDGIATCSCNFACECPRPVIFTPQSLQGGLRCPAIVVNESWGSACRAVGCSTRWVAIDVKQKLLVVSAHLPHRRRLFFSRICGVAGGAHGSLPPVPPQENLVCHGCELQNVRNL